MKMNKSRERCFGFIDQSQKQYIRKVEGSYLREVLLMWAVKPLSMLWCKTTQPYLLHSLYFRL